MTETQWLLALYGVTATAVWLAVSLAWERRPMGFRKTKRKRRHAPGRTKRLRALADKWLNAQDRRIPVSAAVTYESYMSTNRGYGRILDGRHPVTNEPLPINEDGAEYLP